MSAEPGAFYHHFAGITDFVAALTGPQRITWTTRAGARYTFTELPVLRTLPDPMPAPQRAPAPPAPPHPPPLPGSGGIARQAPAAGSHEAPSRSAVEW